MVDNYGTWGTGWAGQKSARRQNPASPHIRTEMWVLDWVQQAQGTMPQQTKPFSENTVFAFYSLDVSGARLGWPFIMFWQVLSTVSCPPSWFVMTDTSWVLCSCGRQWGECLWQEEVTCHPLSTRMMLHPTPCSSYHLLPQALQMHASNLLCKIWPFVLSYVLEIGSQVDWVSGSPACSSHELGIQV